jgi:hypothetical protein
MSFFFAPSTAGPDPDPEPGTCESCGYATEDQTATTCATCA